MQLKEYVSTRQFDTSKIRNYLQRGVAERMNEILVLVGNYLEKNGTMSEPLLRKFIMGKYLLSETAVNRNINILKINNFFEFNQKTKEFSLPDYVILEERSEKDDSRATA